MAILPEQDEQKKVLATQDFPDIRAPLSEASKSVKAFGNEMQAFGGGLVGQVAEGARQVLPEMVAKPLTAVRDWGMETYQSNMAENASPYLAPKVGTIEQIHSIGDAGNYLAYQIPKGLLNLTATLGTGGVVGGIARGVAKAGIKELAAKTALATAAKMGPVQQSVAQAATKLGTQLALKTPAAAQQMGKAFAKGAAAGSAASTYMMEGGGSFGEMTTGQNAVAPEKALLPSMGVGAVNAAIEFTEVGLVAKYLGIGSDVVKKGVLQKIKETPELSKKAIELAKGIGKGAAAGVPVEGLQEGVQELVSIGGERWAQEKKLFDALSPEERSRVANSVVAGGLIGGIAGGALGPFQGSAGPQPATPTPAAQTQQIQQASQLGANIGTGQLAATVQNQQSVAQQQATAAIAAAQQQAADTAASAAVATQQVQQAIATAGAPPTAPEISTPPVPPTVTPPGAAPTEQENSVLPPTPDLTQQPSPLPPPITQEAEGLLVAVETAGMPSVVSPYWAKIAADNGVAGETPEQIVQALTEKKVAIEQPVPETINGLQNQEQATDQTTPAPVVEPTVVPPGELSPPLQETTNEAIPPDAEAALAANAAAGDATAASPSPTDTQAADAEAQGQASTQGALALPAQFTLDEQVVDGKTVYSLLYENGTTFVQPSTIAWADTPEGAVQNAIEYKDAWVGEAADEQKFAELQNSQAQVVTPETATEAVASEVAAPPPVWTPNQVNNASVWMNEDQAVVQQLPTTVDSTDPIMYSAAAPSGQVIGKYASVEEAQAAVQQNKEGAVPTLWQQNFADVAAAVADKAALQKLVAEKLSTDKPITNVEQRALEALMQYGSFEEAFEQAPSYGAQHRINKWQEMPESFQEVKDKLGVKAEELSAIPDQIEAPAPQPYSVFQEGEAYKITDYQGNVVDKTFPSSYAAEDAKVAVQDYSNGMSTQMEQDAEIELASQGYSWEDNATGKHVLLDTENKAVATIKQNDDSSYDVVSNGEVYAVNLDNIHQAKLAVAASLKPVEQEDMQTALQNAGYVWNKTGEISQELLDSEGAFMGSVVKKIDDTYSVYNEEGTVATGLATEEEAKNYLANEVPIAQASAPAPTTPSVQSTPNSSYQEGNVWKVTDSQGTTVKGDFPTQAAADMVKQQVMWYDDGSLTQAELGDTVKLAEKGLVWSPSTGGKLLSVTDKEGGLQGWIEANDTGYAAFNKDGTIFYETTSLGTAKSMLVGDVLAQTALEEDWETQLYGHTAQDAQGKNLPEAYPTAEAAQAVTKANKLYSDGMINSEELNTTTDLAKKGFVWSNYILYDKDSNKAGYIKLVVGGYEAHDANDVLLGTVSNADYSKAHKLVASNALSKGWVQGISAQTAPSSSALTWNEPINYNSGNKVWHSSHGYYIKQLAGSGLFKLFDPDYVSVDVPAGATLDEVKAVAEADATQIQTVPAQTAPAKPSVSTTNDVIALASDGTIDLATEVALSILVQQGTVTQALANIAFLNGPSFTNPVTDLLKKWEADPSTMPVTFSGATPAAVPAPAKQTVSSYSDLTNVVVPSNLPSIEQAAVSMAFSTGNLDNVTPTTAGAIEINKIYDKWKHDLSTIPFIIKGINDTPANIAKLVMAGANPPGSIASASPTIVSAKDINKAWDLGQIDEKTAVQKLHAYIQEKVAKAKLSFSNMFQIAGKPGGFSQGGVFHDKETRRRWYVKKSANKEHANSEILAAELYRAAGVFVPEYKYIKIDGKIGDKSYYSQPGVASRMIPGIHKDRVGLASGNIAGVFDNFVIDAWLGNWDVIGANEGAYGNMQVVGDRAVRIDFGGALRFSATGSYKPGAGFSSSVVELSTMRDPSINKEAAEIFAGVQNVHLAAGAQKLASISDEQIRYLVEKFTTVNPEQLTQTLIARKADILKQLGSKHKPKAWTQEMQELEEKFLLAVQNTTEFDLTDVLSISKKYQDKFGKDAVNEMLTRMAEYASKEKAPTLHQWTDKPSLEEDLLLQDPHKTVWAEWKQEFKSDPYDPGQTTSINRYGTIIINPQTNKVLIRRVTKDLSGAVSPNDGFGGYVWSFGGGGVKSTSHMLEGAKKETREEFGIDSTVIGVIPKAFSKGKNSSAPLRFYYVGVQKGEVGSLGQPGNIETAKTMWATYAEAKELLSLTTDANGRDRELRTLDAVFSMGEHKNGFHYKGNAKALEKYYKDTNQFTKDFPKIAAKLPYMNGQLKPLGELTTLQQLEIAVAHQTKMTNPKLTGVKLATLAKILLDQRRKMLLANGVDVKAIVPGTAAKTTIENAIAAAKIAGKPVLISAAHASKGKEGLLNDLFLPGSHQGGGIGGYDTGFAFFAGETADFVKGNWGGSVVYPLILKYKNPKFIDASNKYYSNFSHDGLDLTDNILKAKAEGYDGLILHKIKDSGPRSTQYLFWDSDTAISSVLEKVNFEGNTLYSNRVLKPEEAVILEEAQAVLEDAFGADALRAAQKNGFVVLHEEETDDNVAGKFEDGVLHLYLENIAPEELVGYALHEGVHAKLSDMLGESLSAYHKDLMDLVASGNDLAKQAVETTALAGADRFGIPHKLEEELSNEQRIAEVNRVRALLPPAFVIQEDFAYYTQAAALSDTSTGLFRRIISAIKAWFAQSALGKWFKQHGMGVTLNDSMAVALANTAVKRQLAEGSTAQEAYYAKVWNLARQQWKKEAGFPNGRFNLDKAYEFMQKQIQENGKVNLTYAFGAYLGSIENHADKNKYLDKFGQKHSTIYNYTLNVEEAALPRMLLWDKPLTEQPRFIQDIIANPANNFYMLRMALKAQTTSAPYPYSYKAPANTKGLGGSLMRALWEDQLGGSYSQTVSHNPAQSKKELEAKKAVSAKLRDIGIVGLRYLRTTDQKAGKGKYNYVIWDQNTLDKTAIISMETMKKTGFGWTQDSIKNISNEGDMLILTTGPEAVVYQKREPTKASGTSVATVDEWLGKAMQAVHKSYQQLITTVQSVPELISLIHKELGVKLDIPTDVVGLHVGGKVYLVADNIKDKAAAERALAHELVGHFGLEEVLGKVELNRVLGQVKQLIKELNPAVEKALHVVQRNYQEKNTVGGVEQSKYVLDKDQEAREVLAHLAESNPRFGLIRQIIAKIKMFLAKFGIGNRAEAELEALLISAARQIKNGTVSTNGKSTSIKELDPQFLRISDLNPFTLGENFRQFIFDPTDEYHNISRMDSFRQYVQDRFLQLKKKELSVGTEHTAYTAETLSHKIKSKRVEEMNRDFVDPMLQLAIKNGWDLEKDVGQLAYARAALEANPQLRLRMASVWLKEMENHLPAVIKVQMAMEKKKLRANKALLVNNKKPLRQAYFDLMEKYVQYADVDFHEEWNVVSSKPTGMTDTDAQAIIEKYQGNADMDQLMSLFDSMNRQSIDTYLEAGMMTKEMAGKWSNAYKHYATLKREGYEQEGGGPGMGFSPAKPSRLRFFSAKRAADVFANTIMTATRAIELAENNRVMNAVADFIEANPDEDFWKIIDKSTTPFLDADGFVQFGPSNAIKTAKQAIFYRNGKMKLIEAQHDDRAISIIQALNNLNTPVLGPVMTLMMKANRFMARMNTSWSPEFFFVNPIRDLLTAQFNMSVSEADGKRMEIFKSLPSSIKALNQIYNARRKGEAVDQTDEMVKWVEAFENSGAPTGWLDTFFTAEDKIKELEKRRKQLLPGFNWHKGLFRAEKWIEDHNAVMENGIRFATFRALVGDLNNPQMDLSKAAGIVKDLTVNFNRRGSAGPAINALYMFAGAGIQGTAQILMAMKNAKVQKMLAGTIAFSFVVDQLNRMLDDDDDYDKIAKHLKERNLIFKNLTGIGPKYLMIPAPWGYNVFWGVGQKMSEAASNTFGKPIPGWTVTGAAASLSSTFFNAFMPVNGGTLLQAVMPTMLDPLAQIAENKDAFGKALKPEPFPGEVKPLSEQYWANASDFSVKAAELVNSAFGLGDNVTQSPLSFSPEWLDAIGEQIFGSVGRQTKDVIWDFTLGPALGVKDFEIEQLPVLRKFTAFDTPGQSTAIYHERVAQVLDVDKRLRAYEEGPRENREKLAELRKESRSLLGMLDYTKDVERQLRSMRQRLKLAQARGADAQVKILKDKMELLRKRFNSSFERRVL